MKAQEQARENKGYLTTFRTSFLAYEETVAYAYSTEHLRLPNPHQAANSDEESAGHPQSHLPRRKSLLHPSPPWHVLPRQERKTCSLRCRKVPDGHHEHNDEISPAGVDCSTNQ